MEDTASIPIISTFLDDKSDVEGELLSAPSRGLGLCKVKIGDQVVVRHERRLRPLNDAARVLLEQVK